MYREENEIARIVRYQLFSYQQMAVNNCLTLVVSCFFRTTVPQFISLYFPMIYVVHLSTASLPHCVLSYVDVARSSYVSSLTRIVTLPRYICYVWGLPVF